MPVEKGRKPHCLVHAVNKLPTCSSWLRGGELRFHWPWGVYHCSCWVKVGFLALSLGKVPFIVLSFDLWANFFRLKHT